MYAIQSRRVHEPVSLLFYKKNEQLLYKKMSRYSNCSAVINIADFFCSAIINWNLDSKLICILLILFYFFIALLNVLRNHIYSKECYQCLDNQLLFSQSPIQKKVPTNWNILYATNISARGRVVYVV